MTNNITSPPLNGQNSFGTEDYRTAENMISRRSGYENDAREKLKHLHKHLHILYYIDLVYFLIL